MDMISLVEISAFSFPKKPAEVNQDFILLPKKIDDGYLMAVADGVGSYKGGDKASRIAIKYLDALNKSSDLYDVDKLFLNIKNAIYDDLSYDNDFSGAATTLTFVFINDKGLLIGHIGDCRAYIKKGYKLKQVTKDHTQYQKLIDEKVFTKKYLKDKKAKNILTTAIASNVYMQCESYIIPVEELPLNDGCFCLFLMSDGAHEIWENRPRFSHNTMNNVTHFSSSLRRRIETKGPIDDYSLVGIKVGFI